MLVDYINMYEVAGEHAASGFLACILGSGCELQSYVTAPLVGPCGDSDLWT